MEPGCNLVLIGFMGTGKSTLGRGVAVLAGCSFYDMDAEIERRAGKGIPEIFAERGEAFFREMETALAAEWGRTLTGSVIACGGGVVLNEGNVRALGERGVLVCLTARAEVILERTGRERNRPLLETQEREKRIRDLLAARAELYGRIAHQVETSDGTPDELVRRLMAVWRGGCGGSGR